MNKEYSELTADMLDNFLIELSHNTTQDKLEMPIEFMEELVSYTKKCSINNIKDIVAQFLKERYE